MESHGWRQVTTAQSHQAYFSHVLSRLQALWPSRLRCLQQRVSPGVHSDFVGGQMSEESVALAPEKLGRPFPDYGGRNARLDGELRLGHAHGATRTRPAQSQPPHAPGAHTHKGRPISNEGVEARQGTRRGWRRRSEGRRTRAGEGSDASSSFEWMDYFAHTQPDGAGRASHPRAVLKQHCLRHQARCAGRAPPEAPAA